MGVGTNVQDRAIALHHLDAPWRPADVAQREGRILRQGNLNRMAARSRSSGTSPKGRSTATCGRPWNARPRFIGQVMHGRLDTREIGDIGDTALSFSEVKALATGNPLLMDKAEADAALARLQRAERAQLRNQDALRHAITEYEHGHQQAHHARRRHRHRDRTTAGHPRRQLRHDRRRYAAHASAPTPDSTSRTCWREKSPSWPALRRAVSTGRLGGFAVNAEVYQSLGTTKVTINLDGAPGTTIELPASDLRAADPVGLITRLEHRLAELETRKARALADIEHARRQIAHARGSIGQPFPHAAELTAARTRVRDIDDALDRMARDEAKRAQAAAGQEAGSPSSHREPGARDTKIGGDPTQKTHPRNGPDDFAQREQANRAAVAANEAYRAGDLDQAGQLVDQAAALDPSRAPSLWQQHSE